MSGASPKAYRLWKEITARHFRAKDYVVDFLSYTEVRYREGARSITFSSEIIQDTECPKKWGLAIYVPSWLQWDGEHQGEAIDANKKHLLLSGLESALTAKVGHYKILEFTPQQAPPGETPR